MTLIQDRAPPSPDSVYGPAAPSCPARLDTRLCPSPVLLTIQFMNTSWAHYFQNSSQKYCPLSVSHSSLCLDCSNGLQAPFLLPVMPQIQSLNKRVANCCIKGFDFAGYTVSGMATHSSILPGESHRQRSLVGYRATVHRVAKSQTRLND